MARASSRSGFSLTEVTLALGIVAVAISGLLSLYSYAFREGSMGREDTAGAALAERVINPLAFALSSTNIPWSVWTKIGSAAEIRDNDLKVVPVCRLWPAAGWRAYMDASSTVGAGVYVTGSPLKKAQAAYRQLVDLLVPYLEPDVRRFVQGVPTPGEEGGMVYALVVSRDTEFSPVANVAVRCVRANRFVYLISQPMYFTAVHFQGDPNR